MLSNEALQDLKEFYYKSERERERERERNVYKILFRITEEKKIVGTPGHRRKILELRGCVLE
jgi:hypothetical protein